MKINSGIILCGILTIFMYICCYEFGKSFHAVLFMMVWCTVMAGMAWVAIIGIEISNHELAKRRKQENIDREPKKLL